MTVKYRFKRETKDVLSTLAGLSMLFPDQSEELKLLLDVESLTVIAEKTTYSRSRPQENYYRKWCRAFGDWAGLTPDEMHEELLCIAFGTEETETKFGYKTRPAKRSGEVKRDEYSLLIDHLTITAAKMGFAVPPPIGGDF
tara:strand:- start:160 stop:582 length:423 start_codon:yes stop_codon:yes gene_type:complete